MRNKIEGSTEIEKRTNLVCMRTSFKGGLFRQEGGDFPEFKCSIGRNGSVRCLKDFHNSDELASHHTQFNRRKELWESTNY